MQGKNGGERESGKKIRGKRARAAGMAAKVMLCGVLIAPMAWAGTAQAAETELKDQENLDFQTVLHSSASTYVQSFKPGYSGKLTRSTFYIANYPGSGSENYELQVLNKSGEVLAAQRLNAEPNPLWSSYYELDFKWDSPAVLQRGETYFFMLKLDRSAGVMISKADRYPDGQFMSYLTSNPESSEYDVRFTTYMKPDIAEFPFGTLTFSKNYISAGEKSITVTFKLIDEEGNFVQGFEEPVFSVDSDLASIGQVTAGADGYTAQIIPSTRPGTVTFTARVPFDGRTITQTAAVPIVAGAMDVSRSSISSSVSKVQANNIDSTKIRVRLKDSYDNPIVNRDVYLDQDGATGVRGMLGATTNSDGEAVFVMQSSEVGTVNYFAIEASSNKRASANIPIEFVAASPPEMTLTEQPSADKASSRIQVQVSAAAEGHSIKSVKWAAGEQKASYLKSKGTDVADARFTVNRNGVYSVYALDSAGNETVKTIDISGIEIPLSASLSTVEFERSQMAVDESVKVTITLKNEDGTAYTGSPSVFPQTSLGEFRDLKSLGNGIYEAILYSGEAAGRAKVSVTVNGQKLDREPQIEVKPGAADPQASVVQAAPERVSADGKSRAHLFVYVYDKYQNPLPGQEVRLDTGSDKITAYPGNSVTTNSLGKAEFEVASDIAQTVGLTPYIIQDGRGVNLGNPASVEFVYDIKPELAFETELLRSLPITMNITASAEAKGKFNALTALKWAAGQQNAEYFAAEGIDMESGGSFSVTESGMYTVYARDAAGNETIEYLDLQIPLSAETALASLKLIASGAESGKALLYNADTQAYEATVASDVSAIRLLPSALDPSATVELGGEPIAYGEASKELTLETGANSFDLVVRAQDGLASQAYAIRITRQEPDPEPQQPEPNEPTQPNEPVQPPVNNSGGSGSGNSGAQQPVESVTVPVQPVQPAASWNLGGGSSAFTVTREAVMNGRISLTSEGSQAAASLGAETLKTWYDLNPKAQVALKVAGGELSLPLAQLYEAAGGASPGSTPRTVELSAAPPAQGSLQSIQAEAGRLGASVLAQPVSWSISLTGGDAAAESAAAKLRQAAVARLLWTPAAAAPASSAAAGRAAARFGSAAGVSAGFAPAESPSASAAQAAASPAGANGGAGTAAAPGTLVRWDADAGAFRFVTANLGLGEANVPVDGGIYAVVNRPASFADLAGHWARTDAEKLASSLIVEGRTASTFEPGGTLTRGELSALLVRALGLGASAQPAPFADTAGGWYAADVNAAYAAGLVRGSGNAFRPNAAVTREEMAVMLERALSLQAAEAAASAQSGAAVSGSSGASFEDVRAGVWIPAAAGIQPSANAAASGERVSSWASEAVQTLQNAGILQGDVGGKLRPQANVTRAEAAALLVRLLERGGRMS
ncbi:invasin domain 3-containing protein [Saccharibacillus sp. CPCC 101409]|uniref:invasin domain 3-containing protein n=1 Tax=Saccharibacillus sp. CPCC 101409 TaxID=3058041 RepID=UPI002672747D|nr:invasin domain 3-containing protein [Saccharibacillus sp. CPCC 101409]MDO3408372.1 invasin domain 3-containing protein [Saccharibacillus sp. CPCC 101409]